MRILLALVLAGYSALLVKFMVFKDVPVIRIGHMMFKFGGTESGYPPNFVPFATIASYLAGEKGLLIGAVNLVGNVVLLVPVGVLLPLIYSRMTWSASVLLGIAAGLSIELLQSVLQIGIFDIDDVILNALGVVVGYVLYRATRYWARRGGRLG